MSLKSRMKARKTGDATSAKSLVKLKWATFCKSIAVEPETHENTLIGIMPLVNVQIAAPAGQEGGPFNIPLPLWIFAQFDVINPPAYKRQEKLSLVLEFGKDRLKTDVSLTLNPLIEIASANIRVLMPQGIPLVGGLQTLSGIFFYNEDEIGRVRLPITVTVTTIPQSQGSN